MSSVQYRPSDEVDFVVIGAGAAGGVMAKELSGTGFRVVVLEQGVRQLLAQPRCRLPRRETDALLRQLLGS